MKSKFGDREISRENVDSILDTRIFRIVGKREWVVKSGFYDRPFICYNRSQDRHHAYQNPHTAFRATVYADGFEGYGADDIPEGDLQKLKAWLERHRYLQLLVSDDMMRGPERAMFNRLCIELATKMGRPVNEVKREILTQTIIAATLEGEAAVESLGETIGLDRRRIAEITAIGRNVNWHGALIVREIREQEDLMTACGAELSALLEARSTLFDDAARRESHLRNVKNIATLLGTIKDRPWRSLAQRDIQDLEQYVGYGSTGVEALIQAELFLRRPVAAHKCFYLSRQINVVLYRLAMAEARQGNIRSALLDRGYAELVAIRDSIDPATGEILQRNPLWSALGRINDALHIWRASSSHFEDVRNLLRHAAATFG